MLLWQVLLPMVREKKPQLAFFQDILFNVSITCFKIIGTAPEFDRQISLERQAFLRNFVEAQMVTYESVDTGVSSGWFYCKFNL